MTAVFDRAPIYLLSGDTLHRDPVAACELAEGAEQVDPATASALLATPSVQPCPHCIGISEEE